MKRNIKLTEKELENLKKKFEKLEKANHRLQKEKIEKDEIIKQYMELTDEVVDRLKKETGLAGFFKLGNFRFQLAVQKLNLLHSSASEKE